MNLIESLLEQPSVIALGWALIHFIWQGALVALLLAGVLRVFRDWSTNARYGAACVAMVMLMAAPVTTMAIIGLSSNDNTAGGRLYVIAAQSESQAAPVSHEPATTLTQSDYGMAARRSRGFNLSGWFASLVPAAPWMILFWVVGVCFFSMRFTCGWYYAQRLRKRGVRPIGAEWRQTLRRLCQQLRVTRPVRLLESTLVKVPMAVGWLRPVILLPVGALTGLTTRQLESIIAHELAHIRRHDYLVNLLQAMIETLLFYHPAVWWVSRQIRHEREHCCDDLAVAVCGDPLAYARALLEMEQLRAAEPQLAVAANGGSLMNRIQRLVIAQPQSTDRFAGDRFVGLLAGVIAMITVVSIGVGAQILNSSVKTGATDIGAQQNVSVQRQEIKTASSSSVERQGQLVDLLINSLRDQHDQVREAAAKSLGIIDDYRAVDALQKSLQDRDEQVRKKVVEALERLNQNQNINDSSNENVDTPPGAQIGRLVNLKTTVADGLQALHSSNPEARADGACSLGRLGAVDAIPALINMLGDDAPIRSMKCWDGGNWSPALHTFKQSSPGEQAAIALASLSQPAVEPLIAALGNGSSSVRRNAAWAIGEIRGGRGSNRSAAVEPLIAALNDGDSWVRVAAAFSLGEMRPRRSTESLVAALGDEAWRVREMAASALGEMKARSGVESLTGILLRDENERVRSKAAWALGEIKDSRALDALTVALNDQDQRVRSTVRQAISEIRD